MTVKTIWGRIQAQDVLPIASEGDTWLFQVPRSMVGRIVAEFWAQDEAGNIGYRAAILTIEHGTIKCIEWLRTGGCFMLALDRPASSMLSINRRIAMDDRPSIEYVSVRPYCNPMSHICRKMEA